jgi:hypothetical protein
LELVHAVPDAVREPGYAQEPDRSWLRCRDNDERESAQQLQESLTGPPILQTVSNVDSRRYAQEHRQGRAAIPYGKPADQGGVEGASDSPENDLREKRHSPPRKTSNTSNSTWRLKSPSDSVSLSPEVHELVPALSR